MRYLITGGCGFLGSNLAHEVLRRGEHLHVFDDLSRLGSVKNLEWLQNIGRFDFYRGDIRNIGDVQQVMTKSRPDVIFHLAGQVAMTTSIASPRMDFEINALGTFNVLEAVRLQQPEAIVIYSSTNKVYGDLEQFAYRETATRYECIDHPRGFDEKTPLEFHSPYGCSKGSADQYMLDFARIFNLNTIVLRHSSMYGGRQYATYDQGWIGWFCQQAIIQKINSAAEPFTISGNGKQVRDVLHAEDTKRLYFNAVHYCSSARGHAFNIGGGMTNSLSLLELFSLLEQIEGVTLNYRQIPARLSDQKVFVADNEKAKLLMHWEPNVSAKEGIKSMLSWLHDELNL